MARLTKYGQYSPTSTLLGDLIDTESGLSFLAVNQVRPATPTIINVATTDGNWTAVTTGQTGVLAWRLSEAAGADFDFAFEAAPTASATAFGWIGAETEITAIYVRRKGATNINAELILWKS